MKIKDLQNAADLIKRYESLESEIKDLTKFAIKVKDKSISLKLNLSYEKPKGETVRLDDDGSIIIDSPVSYSPLSGLLGYFPRHRNDQENKESYDTEVSEVITLEILGVIAAHKEAERMFIIKQLGQFGITIE